MTTDNPQDQHRELIQSAIRLWQDGNSLEAIDILRGVVTLDPESNTAIGLLGCYLYDAGKYDDALPVLRDAGRRSPNSSLASRALFHTLYELKRFNEARTILIQFSEYFEQEDVESILAELDREISDQTTR